MKKPPKTQDDILHEMHEDYMRQVSESEQPLWICEMYANGPLSIHSFPMFSLEETGETHRFECPDPDEYDHCECGNIIPLGEQYCSSKCYIGETGEGYTPHFH